MPYKKSLRKRRPRRKRIPGIATTSKFMPSRLKAQRFNQVSTKTFYFKTNGIIQPSTAGSYQQNWNTRDLAPTVFPPANFDALARLYEEYKVLAMNVRIFPANVGTESNWTQTAPAPGVPSVPRTLDRGDCVIWNDQAPPFKNPASVGDIINFASCKMINARRPFARKIFRAKGHPEWGRLAATGFVPDSWDGQISLAGFLATTAPSPPALPPTLWYFTRSYKILVRGRSQF